MLRIYKYGSSKWSFAGMFLFSALVGCRFQDSSVNTTISYSRKDLDRRIELVVRSQMSVPSDWEVKVGSVSPSPIPEYNKLDIVFSSGHGPNQSQALQFLIAKDGSKLAKLSEYSLTKISGTDIDTAGRPVRGVLDAKVEVIDFDDLECPFCAQMHSTLFPETLNHYKGLVKYYL